MRILYIAHRVPFPPDRGDRIRSYHMIKHLSKLHSVGLVCLASSRGELEQVKALRKFCDSIDVVLMPSLESRARALVGLFSPKPLTLQYFYSRRLKHIIRRHLREGGFDAVLVFSSSMAQFLPPDQRSLKIMDFADVDSDKWFQYAQRTKFPYSKVYRLEGRRLRKYELSVIPLFDYCTVISPEEERLLRSRSGSAVLCTIPNGVDLEYYRAPAMVSDQLTVIFTGVMNYYANVDGVLYFHDQILPRIHQRIPEAKFTVVGGNPTRSIRRLGRNEKVTITGYVRDVRPFLSQAAVCVVPLRIARGMQNKILEAMAMGLPVVTTSRAMEGIDACPGRDLIVADDPGEFAARTVELLMNRQLRLKISRNARNLVESKYRWSNCLQKLDVILETAPKKPSGIATGFRKVPYQDSA
jgi:sugar transferase (PEP-CTERM/EpsH1 system associated)